jgi:hypothetical protein
MMDSGERQPAQVVKRKANPLTLALIGLIVLLVLVLVSVSSSDNRQKTATRGPAAAPNAGTTPTPQNPNTPVSAQEAVVKESAAAALTQPEQPSVPADEGAVVSLLEQCKRRYDAAPNEFQKSTLRRERMAELGRIMTGRTAVGWIGTIAKMETNGSGNGILEVHPPGYNWITIETMPFGGTTIPAGSVMYEQVSRLSVRSKVIFSGELVESSRDYLQELSLTEAGSMDEPEFLFKFTEIRSATAGDSRPKVEEAHSEATEGVIREGGPIPFVGCPSDGQVGPRNIPSSSSPTVPVDLQLTQRLAYYKADLGPGVLAPRGWYCVGTYGSSGDALYVSPEPIAGDIIVGANARGFMGAAIEISRLYGGTSGRFGVARVIARVFPAHRAFVTRVVDEGIVPAVDFPFGPYPLDKLTYRGNEIVEYQTPARAEGLGTDSWLKKNDTPIDGAAILVGENPDLLYVCVRLPADLNDLTALIIRQAEREASGK